MTGEDYIKYMENGEVPPEQIDGLHPGGYTINFKILERSYKQKEQIRNMGMFALVDLMWTKELAEWIGGRKCLEI
jgi:hypothetical protein